MLALMLALVVSGVRLLAWQSERLAPPLMTLDSSLETQGSLGGLSLSLARFDPEPPQPRRSRPEEPGRSAAAAGRACPRGSTA
ncbi:hypothetical protein [Salinicola tamaricis]|uniref:hypothetical protein n=1 Tax=Salinicola tamaricis TaxID=1771309 RepID=UPI00101AD3CA|nr:hypothetical protein [Salinicola tamaricis]